MLLVNKNKNIHGKNHMHVVYNYYDVLISLYLKKATPHIESYVEGS